jgi:EpsI family protein
MEQKFIDALDFSDYAMMDYQDKNGRSVNFYVAYYESQRKGESIHSPETCLPGGGWIFNQSGSITLPFSVGGKNVMKVNRAFMQKSGSTQLVYFWFPQRGRILTNAYQLKIYAFWDALTRQRTDGALVRVLTPVYNLEEPEDAEKRLQEFVRQVSPVLLEFLPGA